jgi:L-aspartate oxidase
MAYRAKADIKEMEFIQFHPTALYDASTGTSFLISEAVRGFGAYLRTKNGHRFMPDYDSRGDLASRDIVSQSIDLELKKTGDDCVYLDCTHLDLAGFIKHFPMIYERCKSVGIDIAKDWIPVVPAQHYLCGGIVVDKNGKTSVENLFACGECSRTGLHGANRLASNSLLEALVYSDKIYHYLANTSIENNPTINTVSEWKLTENPRINPDYVAKTKSELQLLMRQSAGIVRKDADLLKAKTKLSFWLNEIEEKSKNHKISAEFGELHNLVTIGLLIVQQSIDRNENRGGFVKIK